MRYEVMAKRRNTNENYTAWTYGDNYAEAEKDRAHVDELGYEGKIFVRDRAVKELWEILRNFKVGQFPITKLTDIILDAGFAKREVMEAKMRREVEKAKAETARGIFKVLDEMVIPEKCTDGCAYYLDMAELAELEKKYIGEPKNDRT